MNVTQSEQVTGSNDLGQKNGVAVRVDIYIAAHCFTCNYSHEVAERIRQEFPEVSVRLIDLNETDEPVPETVFATPTYLLNGKVWSLGNPSEETVRSTLCELLS